LEPAGGVLWGAGVVEGRGEEVLDLVDGQRDEAGVGWGLLVRGCGGWCLGAGGVPEPGGGDGADGEGGHDEDEVAADRGVEAGLALVEAKIVFSELESFFSQPPVIPVKKKSSLAFRVHPGRY
jgi:hypothetical protein